MASRYFHCNICEGDHGCNGISYRVECDDDDVVSKMKRFRLGNRTLYEAASTELGIYGIPFAAREARLFRLGMLTVAVGGRKVPVKKASNHV